MASGTHGAFGLRNSREKAIQRIGNRSPAPISASTTG
jgi:hypothetical protein